LSTTFKAITVRLPWAWAIAHGHTKINNCPESTDYRGLVAIHAGSSFEDYEIGRVAGLTRRPVGEIVETCELREVIVAVAQLIGVCEGGPFCQCGDWAQPGSNHWRLANVVPIARPVPVRGEAGLWELPPDVAGQVRRQLSPSSLAKFYARPAPQDSQPTEKPVSLSINRPTDFLSVREELLPLPGAEQGYRRVLLLGTTGAGKTTVVRQLLGTHPDTERFPSTSTAKTTVADSELILTGEARFRAAITFASKDEIFSHLSDNVSETAKAVFENRPDDLLVERLLNHISQRFRFSYVLGKPVFGSTDPGDEPDDEVDELDDDAATVAQPPLSDDGDLDQAETAEVLRSAVEAIRHLATMEVEILRTTIVPDEDDERTLDGIIEDELDTRVRRSATCARIVNALLEEIEKRFAILTEGELQHDDDGWPVSWTWQTTDREAFIRTIMRFSSNQARDFGRLLTPLVNGIRVSGPFKPYWAESGARLVLIDGEGLGHTPNSVATLSTNVRKRLDEVDAILLVDNAQQPMQAAPVSAMKTIAATGNGEKLFFLFTHFDQVKGDNLARFSDREQHVLGSAENVLNAIREELGIAERLLRRRLDEARFFVGDIQSVLDPARLDPARKNTAAKRTINQLNALLEALAKEAPPFEVGPSRPIYNRTQLSRAVAEAAMRFHAQWQGTLGLAGNPEAPKRHWATIKALTRRLAEGRSDEYTDLKPAASLRTQLEFQIYGMVQRPLRWSGPQPDDAEQQSVFDTISSTVAKRLFTLTQQIITEERLSDWQRAYAEGGKGSTIRRAHIMATDIYERGAPIPPATAPNHNRFVQAVQEAFTEVAEELKLGLE
jgi:energy-coupling factor transporter ATP-binding protein EcfA2